MRLVVDHSEAGKAMDFLAKSASKIITTRMESDHSALVNVWLIDIIACEFSLKLCGQKCYTDIAIFIC